MNRPFKAVRVSQHVYWVGAIDWAIRNFHGYLTSRGTTYNAFLVLADKITLIDTVKAPFRDEMLSRIASVIEPEKIAYIISNHSEMDHSGCLVEAITILKPEMVFASSLGVKTLAEHFELGCETQAVKDGQSLSLGDVKLTFIETRMLHWPESMFTYLNEDELLFSQDGFGMHLASSERFDEKIAYDVLEAEAAKYYANILLPFSALVTKLLKRVSTLGLPIRTIAPDHGPIWRKYVDRILSLYSRWAAQQPDKKAVVVYDTMWQSTAMMARAVCQGLTDASVSAKLMPIGPAHRSDIATELLDSGALIVGSPTMNNNILPSVADVLTYLKGLKPRNLIGAAFGSYGWSGEAVGQINGLLREMNVKLVSEGVKARYVPGTDALAECRLLGELVGKTLSGEAS